MSSLQDFKLHEKAKASESLLIGLLSFLQFDTKTCHLLLSGYIAESENYAKYKASQKDSEPKTEQPSA
jgi:hypothetical protein